jgi:hypothetical protein
MAKVSFNKLGIKPNTMISKIMFNDVEIEV